MTAAGLKPAFDAAAPRGSPLSLNWDTVVLWTEQARYDPAVTEPRARQLVAAVSDQPDGVLAWIKAYW